jgi:hypothetical protein
MDLPRVIQATNTFISEYNLFETIITTDQEPGEHKVGFYEITDIRDRLDRTIEVRNVYDYERNLIFKLESTAFFRLRKGDILHASIIQRARDWEILEIQFIYPNLAMPFIV